MKAHKNLYQEISSLNNLILAHQKARKGKTKKFYVKEFEENLAYNLKILHDELRNQTYEHRPLDTFVLRDPKTRKISRSDFRDRVVHHAICNIIEPIFDKTFIHDNCANRKGKGSLYALNRFEFFRRKVTKNFTSKGYCLKADIKHYFQEVDQVILMNIIKRKIKCQKTIWLIGRVLRGKEQTKNFKSLPLGNLTSQFFANVYLNELDKFVKHHLKAKYYLRYVDDFVVLHESEVKLKEWKTEINDFLNQNLKLELHPDKSKIINLSKGVDFVGFRNYYHYKLLRKRNIRSFDRKIRKFSKGQISENKMAEIFQGWSAYAMWADTYKLRKRKFNELEEATIHKVI